MTSEWLQNQGFLFWMLIMLLPLYIAWIFHMVYYNIAYARNRGNFEANMANEKKFLAWQEEKERTGRSEHSKDCQHHPANQPKESPWTP